MSTNDTSANRAVQISVYVRPDYAELLTDDNQRRFEEAIERINSKAMASEAELQRLWSDLTKNSMRALEMYEAGNVFRQHDGGLYILSVVGPSSFCLVSLDGNRWDEPVHFEGKTNRHLTESEFEQVAGGEPDEFSFYSKSITVLFPD